MGHLPHQQEQHKTSNDQFHSHKTYHHTKLTKLSSIRPAENPQMVNAYNASINLQWTRQHNPLQTTKNVQNDTQAKKQAYENH